VIRSPTRPGPFHQTVWRVEAVANSLATFRSSAPSTSAYIWRGAPCLRSPFASSGDFTLDVRMRFDTISGSGDAVEAFSWANTTPTGNNPPGGQQPIFAIWGWSNIGLYVQLGTTTVTITNNPYGFHDYKLHDSGGFYSVDLDGVQMISPVAATARPNVITIGNPEFVWWPTGPWSQFDLDYVLVTIP